VREKGLREKRVQRGKPTGKRREGDVGFSCGFLSPLSPLPKRCSSLADTKLPQEKFEAMWDVVDAVPYTYHLLYKPASDLKLIALTKVSEFTSGT